MYLPSEDSFLLANAVKSYNGKSALEIGVGSGVVLQVLYENFQIVAGTDIDLVSLRYCKENLSNDIMLACCDAASAFHHKFDLIVTNPPYLPLEDNEMKDPAIHGNSNGLETTLNFVKSAISVLAKNGKMLIIISSLSIDTTLDEFLFQMKLKRRVISIKKLFFEQLTTLEISFQ
ncbi:MAG TPA: HemK2/MTQ2 family protein methyltransferase [Candidatus Nitrosopolaris sp.]|nr:HemK2/MTQ2 family protein methyltransferase [Candidatus Nitrosopolaris sp.]